MNEPQRRADCYCGYPQGDCFEYNPLGKALMCNACKKPVKEKKSFMILFKRFSKKNEVNVQV